MATIKSFTDLSQSKTLSKILPLETADMRIGNYVGKSGKVDVTNIRYYCRGDSFCAPEIIEAWSLAALLGLMPTAIGNYQLIIETESDVYNVSYDDILSGEILILYADFCLFEAIFKMVVWLTKQGHIKVNDY